MKESIIFLPMLYGFFCYFFRNDRKTILFLMTFFAFAFPFGLFKMEIKGFPDLNFLNVITIPLAFLAFFRGISRWRPSIIDLLIVFYIFWQFLSHYYSLSQPKFNENATPISARGVLLNGFFLILLPYIIGKTIINSQEVAKWVVIVSCITVFLYSYELLARENLYSRVFDSFFPGAWKSASIMKRFGFYRVSGPFTHPIHGGLMMGIALCLQLWLHYAKVWGRGISFFGLFRISSSFLTLTLVVGLLHSVSRGPWLGFFVAYVLLKASLSRLPSISLIMRIIILLVGGLIVYYGFGSYFSTTAETEMQGTAVYRYDLFKFNWEYVLERPIFGWGQISTSFDRSVSSIDNAFLHIALSFGLVGAGLLVSIMTLISAKLFFKGMLMRKEKKQVRFVFFLMSIHICYFVTLVTVWMDPTATFTYFLFTGWSEKYLRCPDDLIEKASVKKANRQVDSNNELKPVIV